MTDILASLSDSLANATERAAAGIVHVHGHRRPAAGVVFAPDLILAPARVLDNDTASILAPNGTTHDGVVLGRAMSFGLGVVRANGLGLEAVQLGGDARVGQLVIAVGRTWSGGVMATLTNVAVVGGPLRTSRTTQLDRVIRIAQPPHGALVGGALIDGAGRVLGVVTGHDIRRTTVVIPAATAWQIAQQIVEKGGTKQGFLGVSSTTVRLREGQRGGRAQEYGLLVTSVVDGAPADVAGVLVGDIIVALDGKPVEEPEALITLLRADRSSSPSTLTIVRGGDSRDLQVTIGERPVRSEGSRGRR
jgi:S1-C subfamily serine protease